MKKTTLVNIFLRSFFIHTTLNFKRMQNMGFAMSVIPLIKELRLKKKESEKFLDTHLQMFNTHPYFSAPIIGSIVRLEEDNISREDVADAVSIKQSLMASYAAIGDIFFWGAFRPFIAIISVVLIYMGLALAPFFYFMTYTPIHFWVRLKGFMEGYRRGKKGFEFIRSLNLPGIAVTIRRVSLMVLIALMLWLSRHGGYWPLVETDGVVVKLTALITVMFCLLLVKKGISQIYIVYSAVVMFVIISWTGWVN